MDDIVELVEDDEEEDEDEGEPNVISDLHEAYTILGQCKALLTYLSDPILCKQISERERKATRRLIEHVSTYRSSVKDYYSTHGLEDLFK